MSNVYNKKPVHIEFVVAKANDPKIEGGKQVLLKTPGSVTGKCAYTGEELTYEPHPVYEILEVVKDEAAARAAGWYNRAYSWYHREKENEMSDERELLEKTNGTQDESVPAVEVKAVVVKEKKEPSAPSFCPTCHGPRRGRGHIHTDDCPINRKNIIVEPKTKDPSSMCPGCGGGRRGRGFTHTDTCSLKKKVE